MSYEKFKSEFMFPFDDETTTAKIELGLKKIGCCNIVVKKMSKRRSTLINNALHLWFTWCEEWCNGQGHTADALIYKKGDDKIYREQLKIEDGLNEKTISKIFDEIFPAMTKSELPITAVMLKDYFRQCCKFMHGKESTSSLTNKEMCETISTCERLWSERLEFTREFPNRNLLEYGEKQR